MKRRWLGLGVGFVIAALAAGCAGDMKSRLASNQALRTQVLDAFRSDGALAASMADNLLGADSTRDVVLDRVLSNGEAAQELMLKTARDPRMLDGVIALAVQDSGTREHVLTLLRGIEMGSGAR